VGTFVLVGGGGDGNDPLLPPLSGPIGTEWDFVGLRRGGFRLPGQQGCFLHLMGCLGAGL
jgi:hypothetical protein